MMILVSYWAAEKNNNNLLLLYVSSMFDAILQQKQTNILGSWIYNEMATFLNFIFSKTIIIILFLSFCNIEDSCFLNTMFILKEYKERTNDKASQVKAQNSMDKRKKNNNVHINRQRVAMCSTMAILILIIITKMIRKNAECTRISALNSLFFHTILSSSFVRTYTKR